MFGMQIFIQAFPLFVLGNLEGGGFTCMQHKWRGGLAKLVMDITEVGGAVLLQSGMTAGPDKCCCHSLPSIPRSHHVPAFSTYACGLRQQSKARYYGTT